MNTILIGEKIKEVRKSKHISLLEVAQKLNMEERTIRRIECGERKTLTAQEICEIAEALETDPIELFKVGLQNGARQSIEKMENIHANVVGLINENITIHSVPVELEKQIAKLAAITKKLLDEKDALIAYQAELLKKNNLG